MTLTATTGAVSLAGVTGASAANACTIVPDPTPTNFTNCPGADFSGFDLSAVDLDFANLQGANLQGATLAENVCPGGLNCGSTEFATAVQLAGANLQNANLTGVFASCFVIPLPLGPVVGGAAANLSGANLSGAIVSGSLSCQLPNGPVDTDFSGATLTGADLTNTELIPLIPSQVVAPSTAGAVVSWSARGPLPGATPGSCTPASGSTFPLGTTTVICQVLDDFGGIATGTKTVNVKLPTTTSLSSSINPTVAGQQVTYTATVSPAQTVGTVSFEDSRTGQPFIPGCEAVPLSGSTATCTTTASSTTGGDNIIAIFSGNDTFWDSLGELTEVVTQQPCQTLAGCDLSGLDFSDARFAGANLAGANLSGADLYRAILTGANLTGANLTGANFSFAVLSGTNFTGTLLVPSNQTVLTFGTSAVVSWPFASSLQGANPGRPTDCTPASGSTFPLGTTTVTCPVFDEATPQNFGTGTFTVTVARPPAVVPYGGVVTEGTSGTSQLDVTVTLSAPSTQTVTAQWNTVFINGASSVQAVPGTDYIAASGTVTFPPGETTETVPITVVNHDLGMPYKLLVVSFHNPTNAGIGGYFGLGFGFLLNNTG